MEYGDDLARWMPILTERSMAVVGWGTLALTWLVTVLVDPTRSDNRPRRGVPS
jgi:hypothetical protein